MGEIRTMPQVLLSEMVVTEREVIEMIKVSRATLNRWRQQDLFPNPVKMGPGRVMYRTADVVKWFEHKGVQVEA